MRAIGLMSGTSLDGVDAAFVETDGEAVSVRGASLTLPYDPALRADLRRLLELAPTVAPSDPFVRDVEARLTARHVEAVAALGVVADIVGFHGQTILHRPAERRTWQIGDAQMLADAIGVPVAWDFRTADVAAGGQGAPFAPMIHAVMAEGLPRPLGVLNVGGVGNATWIGEEMLACDTGPGNGPLDDLVARHKDEAFDREGALARRGRVADAVLARLLDDPYFLRPSPKSLDRLDFSARIATSGLDALDPADAAATLVAFIAEAVARTVFPKPAVAWLVTGGGRHNPAIMDALRARLPNVSPVEAIGWDGDALEAQCFAMLASRVTRGLPLSFPGTTGAPRPMPGGRIASPAG